jgi:tol-pal system protein YbgF
MSTLARIEQRLTELEQRATAAVPVASTSNPDSLYNEGMQSMSDARYAVARTLFEEIVSDHTTHPLAPDAQFQIGQIYALEKNYAAAYSELEKVAQQWSNSPRAPAALVRAAAIAEEQKDIPKAREYYTQVRDRYAGTDEARQATRKLQQLPRRE